MITTTQIIARQGWFGAGLLGVGLVASLALGFGTGILLFFIALLLWLYMFRNPERLSNSIEPNAFVAPIDGIVRDIISSKNQITILVETRFFDVGVIRAPYEIAQGSVSYTHGLSLSCAHKAKQDALNASMRFESVAGREFRLEFAPVIFSSHTIFTHSNLGVGERMGFMKAGMTRIVVPWDSKKGELELKVSIGDKLCALQSVIGYFHEV